MNDRSEISISTIPRRSSQSDFRFHLSSLGPLVFAAVAVCLVCSYLIVSQIQNGGFGFPLDDAWIHQVYARNLGTNGEFAFFPGQPSAGSTSPLWAFLLALGYLLRIDFRIWTIALSLALVTGSAFLSMRLARRLGAASLVADWLVPLFVISEWHLAWAAASGMEIPLFIFLSLLLVDAGETSLHPFFIGVVGGLLTLTRPEGAALVLLVGLGVAINAHSIETHAESLVSNFRRLLDFSFFTFGFVLLLLPYFTFNLISSGSLLPNTFYAKSAEYAELVTGTSLLARWIGLYRHPFLGAQILLVPGVFWSAYRLLRGRKWSLAIAMAWVLLLPALYALRLPVDYQYGRYEMPIIPFVGILGLVGTADLISRVRVGVIRRAWGLTIAALVVAFAVIGANQYTRSVGIVNCEMVATAKWTATNLPNGATIAAHDIGAQGYFDSHPILDLAGLVSPEVIPFIRDQGRLSVWMRARQASYAVFFPDWYPTLAKDPGFVEVHSENCAITHEEGGLDLKVFKIVR